MFNEPMSNYYRGKVAAYKEILGFIWEKSGSDVDPTEFKLSSSEGQKLSLQAVRWLFEKAEARRKEVELLENMLHTASQLSIEEFIS